MKSLVRQILSCVLLLVLISACTKNMSCNNHHDTTPQMQAGESSAQQDSQLSQALQGVGRGSSAADLRQIFSQHLTEDFLRQLGRDRNPDDLQDLTDFHLSFQRLIIDNPGERDELAQLSYDYYQRLLSLCADQFQTCPTLGIYQHSVYAGEIFLLADSLIPDEQREQYIQFVTSVGRPGNNPHILERRLQWMVDDLSDDDTFDVAKFRSLTNLMIYYATLSDGFPEEPIQLLARLAERNAQEAVIVASFERILRLALERQNNSRLMDLAKSHALRVIGRSDLAEIVAMEDSESLIRWKGELQSFSLQEDWKVYYALAGLLSPQASGTLHTHIFNEVTASAASKNDLLQMSLSYIFKKFVFNAYSSHERIGQIWTELFDRYGKVEAMFFEFFTRADALMGEVWNNTYKRQVQTIVTGITPYYNSEQLRPLSQIENYLDHNIRNLVAYPTQFIAGYFASQQGDFDFQFFTLNALMNVNIIHMNSNYFFKEHFEGSAPVMFQFVNLPELRGMEALLSFYISLDERILAAYGLDLSFVESFFDDYMLPEKQFILDEEQRLARAFSSGTSTSRLLGYCQRSQEGDYNFTYRLPFPAAENRFFMGQVYAIGGGYSFGTNPDIVELINIFNRGRLSHNMSETMDVLRLELGIKLNRMRLMKQALHEQGQTELAERIAERIQRLVDREDQFYQDQFQKFHQITDCLHEFEKVEETMRDEFFQQEIAFLKATYQVLQILNSESFDETQIVQVVRQAHPEVFAEHAMLQNLASEAPFVEAVSEQWRSYSLNLKSQISDYREQVDRQTNFRRNTAGRYVYFTNVFERRFRLLHQLRASEKAGRDYPRSRMTDMPRDYEELEQVFRIRSWSQREDAFYSLETRSSENESQFVYKVFTRNGYRTSGQGTRYVFDGTGVWKTIILNMSAMAKTRAYQLAREDYNYQDYRENFRSLLTPHFQKLAENTEKLLERMNTSSEQKQVLRLLQAQNKRRDNPLAAGGAHFLGQSLFGYDNVVDFINLGKYDVFFSTLVSHQMGKFPDFIPGLFGSGPDSEGRDQNPVLHEWIPQVTQGNSQNPAGAVTHVEAEDVNGRRRPRFYNLPNGQLAKNYDDILLFAVKPRARQLIFHDLMQVVMAERGVIDAFVDWTESRNEEQQGLPYDIDLYFHPEPVQAPLILPSIKERYYDYRQQFDYETLNVFKDLESANPETGAQ